MQTQVRLPPSFTSLYRLFLRTSSAAVLHQRRAQINLRKRWRPVFDAGAKVTKELQNCNTDASDASVQEKIEWLRVWNDRMDNSLQFLYNSAKSRGIPNDVTRNLAHFMGLEWRQAAHSFKKMSKWAPHSPPKPSGAKELKNMAAKAQQDQFVHNATSARNQLLLMAEATAGLTLGRNQANLTRLPLRMR